MSNPRLRRLQLDQERLETRFRDSAKIRVVGVSGVPAERYEIAYHVRGLCTAANGDIFERAEHLLEIKLSLNYPRRAPQCKMLTPVFHPNFDEVSVCIGDFWAPSEGLDDLVVRIGRMIAYQDSNVKSPLNGLAARWAAENASLLPVDPEELAPVSGQPPAAEEEKIVVTFESPPEAADYAPPSLSPPEAVVGDDAVFLPRLDFGGLCVAIKSGRTTVGRALANDLQLNHDSISAFHAELSCQGGQIILSDLGSTNGTSINGLGIGEIALSNGDRVAFGEVTADFLT